MEKITLDCNGNMLNVGDQVTGIFSPDIDHLFRIKAIINGNVALDGDPEWHDSKFLKLK